MIDCSNQGREHILIYTDLILPILLRRCAKKRAVNIPSAQLPGKFMAQKITLPPGFLARTLLT
jgi:hypothetical protein